MTKLDKTAYRLKYTAANPSVFGSVATWTADKQFKCAYRSISASENIRAGRNADNKGLRIDYYPKFISFSAGDRVRLNGVDYDIIYKPTDSSFSPISYIDTKATQ